MRVFRVYIKQPVLPISCSGSFLFFIRFRIFRLRHLYVFYKEKARCKKNNLQPHGSQIKEIPKGKTERYLYAVDKCCKKGKCRYDDAGNTASLCPVKAFFLLFPLKRRLCGEFQKTHCRGKEQINHRKSSEHGHRHINLSGNGTVIPKTDQQKNHTYKCKSTLPQRKNP